MSEALTYLVKLADEITPSATRASGSLKGLEASLKTAKTSLASYQAQLTRANALGDIAGHKKYSELVGDTRKKVFDLTQQTEALGSSGGSSLGKLAEAGGPVIAGFAAIYAAEIAVAVGLADLTLKVLEYALEATEAKRQTIALFDALGEGKTTGKQTLELFDELGPKVGRTREELTPWAKQLEAIGITDLGELRGQLTAVSTAAAIGGEEGAAAYENLTRKIHTFIETGQGLKIPIKGLGSLREIGLDVNDVAREMGISSKKLAAELKAGTADAAKFGDALESAITKKGAGALAGLATSLPAVLKVGKEAFHELFDSIDFKPVTGELQQFFGIFSDAEPSGQAFKQGITGGLNAVIVGLGEAVRAFKHFIEDVEIGLLKADLFMKPFVKAWHDLSGAIEETNKPLKKTLGLLEDSITFLPKLVGKAVAGEGAGPLSVPLSPQAFDAKRGVSEGYDTSKLGGGIDRSGLITAPAHASGGMVQPANGEMFASVAPGEYIVPRGGSAPTPSNDNGGGGGVRIENLTLHIDAPHGVTNATDVSAHSLSIALERFQLAVGR